MAINGTVQRKIEIISDNTRRLRRLLPISTAELNNDFFLKKGIERALQVSVEALIDIANRLCSLEEKSPTSNSYNALVQLEDLGYIEDAERYRDMIRFRNFIVHRYEDIQDHIVVNILRNHLDDFTHFVREIEDNA